MQKCYENPFCLKHVKRKCKQKKKRRRGRGRGRGWGTQECKDGLPNACRWQQVPSTTHSKLCICKLPTAQVQSFSGSQTKAFPPPKCSWRITNPFSDRNIHTHTHSLIHSLAESLALSIARAFPYRLSVKEGYSKLLKECVIVCVCLALEKWVSSGCSWSRMQLHLRNNYNKTSAYAYTYSHDSWAQSEISFEQKLTRKNDYSTTTIKLVFNYE